MLEGWELVVVQDLGDEARCSRPVVARYEAGSATLDAFQLVYILLKMWIPDHRSVLKERPDESQVGISLAVFRAVCAALLLQ